MVRFLLRLTLFLTLLFALAVATAQTGSTWQYDFRTGDHLVYKYTVQRQTDADGAQSEVEAHYRTHVLVGSAVDGRVGIGFQRNRESAEMTGYRVKGKDRLAQERPAFLKRMAARPSRFSEAMVLSLAGESQLPWEIARESPSHIVGAIREVMNLPVSAVGEGQVWHGHDLAALDARWVGDETIHGKLCHHIEAASKDISLKLSYWWSPEDGVLEKIEMEGSYANGGGTTREELGMELESRSRGETLDTWLHSSETREGALQVLLLDPAVPVSDAQVTTVLDGDDAKSQGLALAIARARRLSLSSSLVSKLSQNSNDAIRELAEQVSGTTKGETAPQDCGQPLPGKSPPSKFGTLFDSVPATKAHDSIPYLLRVPLTYRADRASPLLVYLSGGAGQAIDGVNSAEDVLSKTDYLVLYPHAGDYWWKRETAQKFDEVLRRVVAQYNVDRDRIYITGFSNGGTGALYFAGLWPQRFAAVVTLMGAGVCMDEVKTGLPNVTNLPILLVHGENDARIAADCSKTTFAALNDQSPLIKPELKILNGREHDITLDSDDGLTLAYFKNKVRDPFPRNVKLNLSDPFAARNYWIEVLHGQPGKSELGARIKPGNLVEIRSREVKQVRLFLRPEFFPGGGDIRVEWNGKRVFSGPMRDVCSASATAANVPAADFNDPRLDRADIHEYTLP